ncbi:MAG: hypothetical protein QXR81_08335 [Candidatus Nezhaarchaeales archaeon]
MSFSIFKKAIVEVVSEGLNVAVNKFIPLVIKYTVPLGARLVIRFGGPSGTKIREYRRSDDKVRTNGVITYLRTTYYAGQEKDDNFGTAANSNGGDARVSWWKLDLGSVYPSVHFIADVSADAAFTWWVKVSVDGVTYTDVYSASIAANTHDKCVLELSDVRYIVIDHYGPSTNKLYLYEAFAYINLAKEVSFGTITTIYENETFGEPIYVFLLSSGAVCYWGYLKDDYKISLIEGTIT